VKWFLALLVLLGGGLAAAAFVVPTNAAVVNGSAISQQQLNSDVSAVADSPDFQCYLNSLAALNGGQLPPVAGAGKGQGGQTATATTAFTAYYLDIEVSNEIADQLAQHRGITSSNEQLAQARTDYQDAITSVMGQVAQQSQDPRYTCGAVKPLTGQEVLSTLPASFVDRQVQSSANSAALREDVAGVGSTDADLRNYFVAHRSDFDTVCMTAAVYSSVSDATAALHQAQTTPFADVAKQAAQSVNLPCVMLPLVTQLGLPSTLKVADLAVGTVSFPVALANGEYALVQVTDRTPTPFTRAEGLVSQVVQSKGATNAQQVLQAAARHSTVTVDPRYGVWNPARADVLVPFTPERSDVPNVGANSAPLFSGPTSG
jgi:hypothetical protein